MARGQDRTWMYVAHKLQGQRPLVLQDKRLKVTLRVNTCIAHNVTENGR